MGRGHGDLGGVRPPSRGVRTAPHVVQDRVALVGRSPRRQPVSLDHLSSLQRGDGGSEDRKERASAQASYLYLREEGVVEARWEP